MKVQLTCTTFYVLSYSAYCLWCGTTNWLSHCKGLNGMKVCEYTFVPMYKCMQTDRQTDRQTQTDSVPASAPISRAIVQCPLIYMGGGGGSEPEPVLTTQKNDTHHLSSQVSKASSCTVYLKTYNWGIPITTTTCQWQLESTALAMAHILYSIHISVQMAMHGKPLQTRNRDPHPPPQIIRYVANSAATRHWRHHYPVFQFYFTHFEWIK